MSRGASGALCTDAWNFSQYLPGIRRSFPEGFDGCRKAKILGRPANASLSEFFSEHAILGPKILDDFLLSMIDPAGEDQE